MRGGWNGDGRETVAEAAGLDRRHFRHCNAAHGGATGRGALLFVAAIGLSAALSAVTIVPAIAQEATSGGASSRQGDAQRPGAGGNAQKPRLQVPAMVLGAPATEMSLAIAIADPALVPRNSYIRVRGLSPLMALSDGHSVGPGAWAVPVAALPDLRVIIPAGIEGKSEVTIALVLIDGGLVAEARTTLIVTAPAARPAAATGESAGRGAGSGGQVAAAIAPPVAPRSLPSQQPAVPAPAPLESPATKPELKPEARAQAETFLARGRAMLAEGNFASARLFLLRAADAGLAEGAIVMGHTFDPNELARLKAVGIRPDPPEARRWYERARELGAGVAVAPLLRRLGP